MTPIEYYQKAIASGEIINDPRQWPVLTKLQELYAAIIDDAERDSGFARFKHWFVKKPAIKSLYVWGSVGAGKTFLMNAFFHCLPIPQKKRWHYVEFMAEIHHQLSLLKGQAEPLNIIGRKLAQQYRVICLDEFVVTEIADAMILARLLTALIANHCVLVFTSNVEPKNLYKNGLQREQFLQTIHLIVENFNVVELVLSDDYRQRNSNLTYFLLSPSGTSLPEMEHFFTNFSAGASVITDALTIAERAVPIKKRAGRTLWCEFTQLCHPPRSQFDYLELVSQFDTIMISHVSPILPHQHDIARLFIKLVDVIYDSQKRLIISSQVPIEAIYVTGLLSQEFQRTKSRLIELATRK